MSMEEYCQQLGRDTKIWQQISSMPSLKGLEVKRNLLVLILVNNLAPWKSEYKHILCLWHNKETYTCKTFFSLYDVSLCSIKFLFVKARNVCQLPESSSSGCQEVLRVPQTQPITIFTSESLWSCCVLLKKNFTAATNLLQQCHLCYNDSHSRAW